MSTMTVASGAAIALAIVVAYAIVAATYWWESRDAHTTGEHTSHLDRHRTHQNTKTPAATG
ncbi:hypothetical protein [Nocardia blacklockiae]|uniref:hypothetical protein n=1 Tax=Nocardia blacklockiae TaxID=480036 RepID=UPI001894B5B8|nr:hypothetical protein [Nocardia blacklockiae]MBF6175819.1 hypothetical protein [Nocardia blacklockiae]